MSARFTDGRGASGFALVTALSLMAFMALLLAVLSTLLQVETRRVDQELRQLEARQNALLGLRLGLAQLQASAGPDQVLTARAEILADVEGIELGAGSRYWTGSWAAGADPLWLVSGDRSGVSGLAEAVAGVALAGSDTVRVPLAGLREAGRSAGGFAWWTSDEGVKARLNLVNPFEDGSTDPLASFLTAQRSGVERISGLGWLADDDLGAEQRRGLREDLGRVVGLDQLVVMAQESAGGGADLRLDPVATLWSRGVLADARDGGLRRDLTRLLGEDFDPGVEGDFDFQQPLYARAEGQPAGVVGPNNWQVLRDFYQNYRLDGASPLTEAGSGGGLEFIPTARHIRLHAHGTFPVILFWQLGVGFVRSPLDSDRLAVTLQPLVAVANPYDVPLAERTYVVHMDSTGGVDGIGNNPPRRSIIMEIDIEGEPVVRNQKNQPHPTDAISLQLLLPRAEDVLNTNLNDGNAQRINDLRFKFRAGFAPGEVRWFSLNNTVQYTNSPIVELSAGNNVVDYAWSQPVPDEDGYIPDLRIPEGVENPEVVVSPRYPGAAKIGLYLHGSEPPFSAAANTWRAAEDLHGGNPLQAGDLLLREHHQTLLHRVEESNHSQESSAVGHRLPRPDPFFYQVMGIRGSTSVDGFPPGGGNAPGVKGLSNYNFRAAGTSFHPAWLYRRSTPNYHIGFSVMNEFSETDFWEPDAVGPGAESSVVLFHIPRAPIESIGELQHANLSGPESNVWTPTYLVGNSWANPHMPRDRVRFDINEAFPANTVQLNRFLYDHPYLLNDTLWDRYFFSALKQEDGTWTEGRNRLAIRRDLSPAELDALFVDSRHAAAGLMIEGAFNINSTSVEAWKAVLGGVSDLQISYVDSFSGGQMERVQNAIFRTPSPGAGADEDYSGSFWRGFRQLDDDRLNALAEEIVSEVKARGPFASLAQFVNRSPSSEVLEHALKGPLQAALDRAESADTGRVNPQPFADQNNSSVAGQGFLFREAALGHRGEAAPGWITQADILSQIGSFISTRSDTFVIRAYGEATADIGAAGGPTARAWCEAVVQRLPDYVDPSQQAWTAVADLSQINNRFGRRFVVLSFRWLTEDDL